MLLYICTRVYLKIRLTRNIIFNLRLNKTDLTFLDDEKSRQYDGLLNDVYLKPKRGHKVLLIQPRMRIINFKNAEIVDDKRKYGPDEEEARALVDSLDNWSTVDTIVCNLRTAKSHPRTFFTKGVWENLSSTIHQMRSLRKVHLRHSNSCEDDELKYPTAIFLNWPRLSTHQLATMQKEWNMPVYDRYTLVVQLFTLRAKSQEAVVQAKLAEIGLLRARIPAFLQSPIDGGQLCSNGQYFNPFSSVPKDRMYNLIDEKESRLLSLLDEINKRNQKKRMQRKTKRKYQYPIVAVIGYTNAGKTSLIRSLSGSKKLKSSPNVFATLDITHHRGRLETDSYKNAKTGLPGFQLMLLDTIGFMSDIPTNLIAAFRATLYECLDADLIIHIVDISLPGWKSKMKHVDKLLESAINISNNLYEAGAINLPFILKVANKIDLLPDDQLMNESDGFDAFISAENQIGICSLANTVQSLLLKQLGWYKRTIALNQGSDDLQWIYANAMITDIQVSSTDSQYLHVTAIYTPENWEKFCFHLHCDIIE